MSYANFGKIVYGRKIPMNFPYKTNQIQNFKPDEDSLCLQILLDERADNIQDLSNGQRIPMVGKRSRSYKTGRKSSPRYGYWRSHCTKKFSLTDRINGKGKAIRSLDFYGNVI